MSTFAKVALAKQAVSRTAHYDDAATTAKSGLSRRARLSSGMGKLFWSLSTLLPYPMPEYPLSLRNGQVLPQPGSGRSP